MVESAAKTRKRDSNISDIRRNSLVLSIDQKDKIIRFNDKCEQVSGYYKDESLDKQFLNFLIPGRYRAQWTNVLASIRKDKMIEEFKLPILTRNGHEIMISWSSFPIKTSENVVGDIDFVGTLINLWDDSENSSVKPLQDVIESPKIDSNFNPNDEAIIQLLNANDELEKKNQKLEDTLKNLKSRRSKKNVHTSYSGKLVYTLADIAGGKKRKQEFERMMKELDAREKQLDKIETKINNDKKSVNEIRNEFVEWREKLELLESDIGSRNKDLENRAKLLDSTLALGKSIGMVSTGLDEGKVTSSGEVDDSSDAFDGISGSAAVIQRGILKQVNKSFADLIGYAADEIVEKSFFDFIAPEGLNGIEKYYLHRLKGERITDYETVFLANDDQMIRTKVSIKPTTFNGEKADIAIFKRLGVADISKRTVAAPSEMTMEPKTETPAAKPEDIAVDSSPPSPDGESVLSVEGESKKEEDTKSEDAPAPDDKMNQVQISEMMEKARAKKEKDK